VNLENFGEKLQKKIYLVSTMGQSFDFNMAEGDIKWFTSKIKHNKTVLTGI
jgi:hypothetical protein